MLSAWVAARALGRHGLVHAYGHCSLRLDEVHFLVAPSRPLGLVAPGETCAVVPLEGGLPEGVLGEVRIHREIYRRRAEVRGPLHAATHHEPGHHGPHRAAAPRLWLLSRQRRPCGTTRSSSVLTPRPRPWPSNSVGAVPSSCAAMAR
ncbi:class II aldolase/adducin family protein [Roseomonas chloroacetimidivorans]|uniref:class II aldolase/adducin family protein n=1 Tax=Roseomonas chloroacetimidivorans TaxID=1766656 RepID=UPI003C76CF9B